ncbi:MAG: hypothetical protein H6559_23250 [Lewinellaceae bacterium]|nr:hypothetical protein [Lewinellaceae bacterium]
MIPLHILKLILLYFDSIDKTALIGLSNKKPKNEESLTSDLCALLDGDEQKQFMLDFNFEQLKRKIKEIYPKLPFEINFKTNEYSKAYEGSITHSDLGLIINFLNYLNPKDSWTESWLFQAKSLKINDGLKYKLNSDFPATNKDQFLKLKKLTRTLKLDFIRYLHYCPRLDSKSIEETDRDKLKFLRDASLSRQIFDFQIGLELYNTVVNKNSSSLNGGIIISPLLEKNLKFSDLHAEFVIRHIPFAWFLLSRLSIDSLSRRSFIRPQDDWIPDFEDTRILLDNEKSIIPKVDKNDLKTVAHGIVRGDKNAIQIVEETFGIESKNYTIFPERTLTINLRIGG